METKRGLEIKRGGERGRESKFHLPKMFLILWLHHVESMIDFEKSTFFHREVIFHSVREVLGL